MNTKPHDNDEDKPAEAELTDEQLEKVAGGTSASSLRAVHDPAALLDQAATMTAIALAESGGRQG